MTRQDHVVSWAYRTRPAPAVRLKAASPHWTRQAHRQPKTSQSWNQQSTKQAD